MSLTLENRVDLYFGHVLAYDAEYATIELGPKSKAMFKLEPSNLRGTRVLFPGDRVALWKQGSDFVARLLSPSELRNLERKAALE